MIFEIKCSFSLIKQFRLYFILYKTFPNCENFLELSDESDVDRFYHVSTGKTTGKKRRWGSTFAFTMKVKKSGKKNLTPHPPQKVGSSYPNHTYQPRPKQCATQCMIIGFKYLRLLTMGNVISKTIPPQQRIIQIQDRSYKNQSIQVTACIKYTLHRNITSFRLFLL